MTKLTSEEHNLRAIDALEAGINLAIGGIHGRHELGHLVDHAQGLIALNDAKAIIQEREEIRAHLERVAKDRESKPTFKPETIEAAKEVENGDV